jgi:hypothetical protein
VTLHVVAALLPIKTDPCEENNSKLTDRKESAELNECADFLDQSVKRTSPRLQGERGDGITENDTAALSLNPVRPESV